MFASFTTMEMRTTQVTRSLVIFWLLMKNARWLTAYKVEIFSLHCTKLQSDLKLIISVIELCIYNYVTFLADQQHLNRCALEHRDNTALEMRANVAEASKTWLSCDPPI